MKRSVIIILVLIAAGAGWWGYQNYFVPWRNQAAAPELPAEDIDDLENVIWASGSLVPELWAGLSPETTGIVSHIYVAEGDWVEAGALLIDLQNQMVASEVARAEANVAESEAMLASLRAEATTAEVTAAEARVATAQAQVMLATGALIECEAAIAQAEAQVQIVNSQYAELASHPTATELTAAEAEIAVAEAAVAHAQAAFNVVRGDPQIGSRPESLALYSATAALEAAKAKADVVKQGATNEQLAVISSQIAAAEAAVAQARSQETGAEAAVLAALAEQASAEAALVQLHNGATAEAIAIAEAHLLSAQAALQSAKAQLRQSQILAPFAGQVAAINVRVGEMATPGQSALRLGDPQRMHIETTDLRETDVVRLQTGMVVEVTFDALPDQFFVGTITDIAPVSNAEKGSTNYTVHIDVAEIEPSLRWGMTAFVNIETDR
jgi:HlyD family secretion protein